jgi:selenocysteine lyase/cysteine desulfurase
MGAVIDYVCKIGTAFTAETDRRALYQTGIEQIHLQEQALLHRLLEGSDNLPGLRHIPGVQVFADDLPLNRRDLIAAIGIAGLDVSDAVKEYEKRGVIVCDRSNRSIYAKRIVEALGTTGTIRVSPLHCHGAEDIDRFLEITKSLAQTAKT